ncbi:hypothetical protein GOP47_0023528 [Adiantum capillus-veneris]|uniref:Large ribosomal subunit protein uL15/eL18 domain-containing protein n=1 Tax=Adiantum capillus-veneris TaxID=13818 RepID=A0A9D4U4T7_ADICA|nr:hypothetical protein GOP47_0023528 [Adiantum capillus-veneris]
MARAAAAAIVPSRTLLKEHITQVPSFSKCSFARGQPLTTLVSVSSPNQQRSSILSVQATATTLERFTLTNIGPQPGSRKKAMRKGRGHGAGQGGSCGFGMRGQKSRSGPGVRPGFEGGQTPLYRRLPKLRGIAGGMKKGLPKFVTVNLSDIAVADYKEGEEVSLETLKSKGILKPTGRDRRLRLKILGDGELHAKLSVKAGAFSGVAKEKLEAAGCTMIPVPGPKKWVKPSVAKHQARAVEYFAKKFGSSTSSTS